MFDDSRHTRLQKRFKGLSRVASAISDLYIYGIYEQNFPVLVSKLDEAKSLVKKEIVETKKEMAWLEGIEYIADEDVNDNLRKLPEF